MILVTIPRITAAAHKLRPVRRKEMKNTVTGWVRGEKVRGGEEGRDGWREGGREGGKEGKREGGMYSK